MPDTISTRGPAAPPDQRLRAVLDAAGLRYEMHANRAGSPYAGFRFAAADAEPVAMTAMLRGPVLQLAAHELRAGAADEHDLRAANRFNHEWLLGRLYHHAERGGWEAATSVYLGEADVSCSGVEHAIADLQLVARLVRGATPLASVASHEVSDALGASRLRVPRAPVAVSLLDVETALSALGIRYRIADDAQRVLVRLTERDGLDFLVEFYKSEERFLHVRARTPDDRVVPDDASTFARMQRLNTGILIGAVLFAPEPPRLYHHAALPLAWLKVDGGLVRWLIDHAAAALAAS